ncbi:MAG: hypothetical protein P8J37_01790 [Fuerstiella sp.]|nr:hypothetical protein [Fuerstiella sp.]
MIPVCIVISIGEAAPPPNVHKVYSDLCCRVAAPNVFPFKTFVLPRAPRSNQFDDERPGYPAAMIPQGAALEAVLSFTAGLAATTVVMLTSGVIILQAQRT